ncbi:Uncharacterized protein YoxC, contains an MCP-like domain [Halobacillus dabanensis]|uniref:Uncharacterized protein YoxC, contains an MCP-like domain n=1 Tax=Halobacillus dabanensis TaxID=240302 RepID=A0A1I3WKX5_HALDA|nr:DUF948 domain-containing protein [Halobacillus dabanensis]SFK08188.1 Uncharacterized protein YoxC, contains an MCP-like domain [Halobacillus dabanensis]
MDYLGIGVLIIGIAFAIVSIFLIKALNNLAGVLTGVRKTVDQLPDQLDSVMKETTGVLHHSNDTLADVNEKIRALSPLFYIVGDIGESSRKLTSSLVDMTYSLKQTTHEGEQKINEEGWRGIYGALALTYYFSQKRKALKAAQVESTS